MPRVDPKFVHGREGKFVYEVDMGVADGRWGKIFTVRADNARQAMQRAKNFDITRIFNTQEYQMFLQEFHYEPHPVRIFNRKTGWVEYDWFDGFR